MSRLARWLRLWFTFEERVGRREYVASGVALAAVKYAGDVLLVWSATGRLWAPIDYLRPVGALVAAKLAGAPPSLLPVLALWALPFLWIGVSMSMRRAIDAGYSAWLALLFFVPGVNYAFMGLMSLLSTDAGAAVRAAAPAPRPYEHRLPGALLAIAAGAAIGLGMLALSVYGLSSYGASLFLGTPFVMSAITGFLLNRRYPASRRETIEAAFMAVGITGGVTLLTALEGAVCLVMALPLALALAAMGASLGRRIALHDRGPASNALLAIVVLPLSSALEADRPPTVLREVRSSVEVDAPADVVWRDVVAFPPLPEPTDVVFRTGIAYPKSAEISGQGVGAVRRCVFSTGAFVEPITRWEPERRLSFDVASQPRPLHEWSPFADVAPPHLDGYFRSRRGEFRLTPLPGGRTRLEGSTWYEMRLYPEAYWVLFGDALIARIHGRVLRHVKRTAELEAARKG
jgi:uncharacterized membrane protein YhaH (DUF805 family)